MQNCNSKFKSDLTDRCFQFSFDIIKMCDNLPQKRSVVIISDQIIRSATSVGANIVEGKASSSRREFTKYYQISLKSANETLYWLKLLKKLDYLDSKSITILENECDEICRMLASGIIKLKKN